MKQNKHKHISACHLPPVLPSNLIPPIHYELQYMKLDDDDDNNTNLLNVEIQNYSYVIVHYYFVNQI